MNFEQGTLDTVDADLPSYEDIASLTGPALTKAFSAGLTAVAAALGTAPDAVRSRLKKTVGLQGKHVADVYDLQEGLRVLRGWLHDPATYVPAPRRPRVKRPEGIGELPVPRTTKTASRATTCGLCADPVPAGDLIGRFRAPKGEPYTVMGWLCRHCLYLRREQPRRRDLVLRIFHHLLAGSAVDLNAYECQVLHDWLTAEPVIAASKPWSADPLDTTVERLATAAEEGKPGTWIAVTTAVTIVDVLLHLPPPAAEATADRDDRELLLAVRQHLSEWDTNPQKVEARRYGTGTRYRTRVLEVTRHPSALSARGGPFDLHHSPRPAIDAEDGEEDGTADSPSTAA